MTRKSVTNDVIEISNNLMKSTNIKDNYKLLSIAVQIHRNYLYAKANVVCNLDLNPPALEAIAVRIDNIAEAIKDLNLD